MSQRDAGEVTVRSLDHTGDLGFEIEAPDLERLLAAALGAFASAITDLDTLRPEHEATVEVAGEGADLALVELLGEALYRFETTGVLYFGGELRVERRGEETVVRGRLRGDRLDPRRHPHRVAVKAVTYHQLAVERRGGGWWGRFVLDI